MILISNDFWHKRKKYNFEPYNVLLVISTDIAAGYDCFCAPGTLICRFLRIASLYLTSLTFSPNSDFYLVNYFFFCCNSKFTSYNLNNNKKSPQFRLYSPHTCDFCLIILSLYLAFRHKIENMN